MAVMALSNGKQSQNKFYDPNPDSDHPKNLPFSLNAYSSKNVMKTHLFRFDEK